MRTVIDAPEIRADKKDLPSKKRVWGFRAPARHRIRKSASQVAESRREIRSTPTTIALGRWLYLQPDPIGIQRGKNHLYVYAGNNPLGAVDPLGLDFTNIGSRDVWVLMEGAWSPVSPGATLFGETDAAVSVPEKKDGECPKKCRAYKWVDCYDAMGAGFPSGSLLVKLNFCGQKHVGGKSTFRKVVCSNPVTAAFAQTAEGGWVDPFAEFGSAPSGCER